MACTRGARISRRRSGISRFWSSCSKRWDESEVWHGNRDNSCRAAHADRSGRSDGVSRDAGDRVRALAAVTACGGQRSGGGRPGGLCAGDRQAESPRWLRHRRRHRRHFSDAESRDDARQVQHRALARRGRSTVHHSRSWSVSHPSARRRGPRHRDRSRSGRSDSRAARHLALVRSLRRSRHSRDPPVPGQGGMDAALYGERRRQRLPAPVPGAHLHPIALTGIRAILLDIEGTTTPIEFVQHVLFPYARARVHDSLEQRDVAALRVEYQSEPPHADLPAWDAANERASAEAYVYWLMDRDRKSTALKALQGRIWEAGYRAGELKGKGAVYRDVRPALARWQKAGKRIAIFSSGSIQAQRNLFANTTDGDLSSFLSGYFDTTTGSKREATSYRQIAATLGQEPRDVLFISDVTAELDAARAAGMQTALCVRGAGSPDTDHPRIRSFAELA